MICCKMPKIRKRSQMELVGLVVVVILIAVGMLFVIRFVVMKEPSQTKKYIEQSELASNTISAILETTVDCHGISVRMNELFRDCAGFETYDCIADSPPPAPGSCFAEGNYAGADSCTFLNCTLETILDGSLESWNREYVFTAHVLNDPSRHAITNISNSVCAFEKETEIYPLPLNPGTLIIQLDICG